MSGGRIGVRDWVIAAGVAAALLAAGRQTAPPVASGSKTASEGDTVG